MDYKVRSGVVYNGGGYGIQAIVQAYNHASAESQLDWITQNKKCMCKECLEEYKTAYLTSIILPQSMPVYNVCVKE